ncbi:MAG: cobaltochelatase subunit CobN [Cyanobacteriota bacterium]
MKSGGAAVRLTSTLRLAQGITGEKLKLVSFPRYELPITHYQLPIMHRINATPGGWNQSQGLSFISQSPAPFVLITAADTDIQTLAAVVPKLPTATNKYRCL